MAPTSLLSTVLFCSWSNTSNASTSFRWAIGDEPGPPSTVGYSRRGELYYFLGGNRGGRSSPFFWKKSSKNDINIFSQRVFFKKIRTLLLPRFFFARPYFAGVKCSFQGYFDKNLRNSYTSRNGGPKLTGIIHFLEWWRINWLFPSERGGRENLSGSFRSISSATRSIDKTFASPRPFPLKRTKAVFLLYHSETERKKKAVRELWRSSSYDKTRLQVSHHRTWFFTFCPPHSWRPRRPSRQPPPSTTLRRKVTT